MQKGALHSLLDAMHYTYQYYTFLIRLQGQGLNDLIVNIQTEQSYPMESSTDHELKNNHYFKYE